jgi:CP family cyanate transporter-like MFS transporter
MTQEGERRSPARLDRLNDQVTRPGGARPASFGSAATSGGPTRVLLALFVVALALRPQILAIGPLLPAIRGDLGISHGVAGLLGTIPVLCMGIFAPLGAVLAASTGTRLAAAICVLTIAGSGLLRAALPGTPALLITTVGIGIGMGVIGPILPAVVRRRAPGHPAAGTGAYVAGLIVGGTVAAGVAVQLVASFGSWRESLAIISAAALVSLAGWWLLLPRDPAERRAVPTWPSLPWRQRLGWHLGLAFAFQSMLFYGSISWIAAVYVERGWTAAEAATLVAILNGSGIVTGLSIPLWADRFGTRRRQLAASAVLAIAGILAVTLGGTATPGSGAALGAATALGVGMGAFFPLVLTLPVDVGGSAADVASLSALMLLVGYALSSISPVLLGIVRDVTGNFQASLWVLVVIAGAMLPLSLTLSERRLRWAGVQ